MTENAIICISRECGSGGRDLGDRIGEMLGIPVYGKELISKVAKKSDMSEEYVKNHEENPSYSHILGVPIGHPALGVQYDGIMTPEKLFLVQTEVIKEIAREEKSCVFVGRCADIILQGRENLHSFFVHAPRNTGLKESWRQKTFPGERQRKR